MARSLGVTGVEAWDIEVPSYPSPPCARHPRQPLSALGRLLHMRPASQEPRGRGLAHERSFTPPLLVLGGSHWPGDACVHLNIV